MFSKNTYQNRRQELAKSLSSGVILIAGNNNCPRNYLANTYPFRQDSNFLYFTGIDMPGLMLLIDVEEGISTLYGNDIALEDAIWTGAQTSLNDKSAKVGIDCVYPKEQLQADLLKAKTVHFLPAYPSDRKIWLADIFGKTINEVSEMYSIELVRAVVKLRSKKTNEEVAQIEDSLNSSTSRLHIEAMKMAISGTAEYEIAGHIESLMLKNNCTPAYRTICSVRGETLHNENYNNTLKKGELLLVDAGAENRMHYASDITRTTPVDGKFTQQQKDIYSIVLEALNKSIDAITPGKNYRDIHLYASKIIASGLKEIGLMKGDIEEAVNLGAHAMFFPHGLGHMLGLDVHDMEDLGEKNVGYDNKILRSEQFGTAFLRMGRMLEKDFVITVEPGIYFIPGLINKWREKALFKDYINYTETEKYLNFGGVRIEDNVLVTSEGSRVLGNPIPKEIKEIESLF